MENKRKLNRRRFIGAGAGAAAGAALTPWTPGALAHNRRPGRPADAGIACSRGAASAFSSSRFETRSPLGLRPARSSRCCRTIGYNEVEFGGRTRARYERPEPRCPRRQPYERRARRALLRRYRLKGIGSHIGATQFRDNLEQVLADAEALGLRYMGRRASRSALPGGNAATVDGYQALRSSLQHVRCRGKPARTASSSTTTTTPPDFTVETERGLRRAAGGDRSDACLLPARHRLGSRGTGGPRCDPEYVRKSCSHLTRLFHVKEQQVALPAVPREGRVRTDVGQPSEVLVGQIVDPGDVNVPLGALQRARDLTSITTSSSATTQPPRCRHRRPRTSATRPACNPAGAA